MFAISRLKGCNFFNLIDITNLIEKMRNRETKTAKKATTIAATVPQEILL